MRLIFLRRHRMPVLLRDYWPLILLGVLLGVVMLPLVGCAGQTPRKQIAAWDDAVYQYMQRTTRLCTGASPVMSKVDCQKRQDLSGRAQAALDTATNAIAGCSPNLPCEAGKAAMAAAEEILKQMETSVYRSQ